VAADLPPDTVIKKLSSAGALYLNKVQYLVGAQYGFQQVLVITNGDKITVANFEGEILIEHTRPAPGTAYVGNARPPGPHTNKPRPSPKS
jgi:putative transposase